jgi:uncharacterized protein (TIGR03437 family)
MNIMPIGTFLCLALLSVTPTLAIAGEFTTSIGGAYPDVVSALTTDSAGNTYVVGTRNTASAVSGLPSSSSVFLSKLDPSGKVPFSHTFGGKGLDTGSAVAVDPTGNIYIAGTTTSPDFPLSHALQSQIFPISSVNGVPAGSGFIMKLSPDGTTILYSTFFGGTLGQSAITSLATDSNGNLYLTGYTLASDFPHSAGMPFGKLSQNPSIPGAMVASISAAGDKILYSGAIAMATPCTTSSCINPGGWEGVGIAVDAAGNAYVAGNDPSATNLPTTPGVLAPNGIGAFAAKVNAGGAGLGYLTYIGSGKVGNDPFFAPENTVYAIAVDAAGNAYLAGKTFDPNFPATPGSYQPVAPASANGINAFLAKLNPTGSAMVWATYLGEQLSPQSIAIDASGDVWATGTTSPYFTLPNANGWSTGPEFLDEVDTTGSKLIYSALYPAGTIAQSVAVDPAGLVHVTGAGGFISVIAPATPPSMKISYFGNAAGGNATARISPAEVISIYGPGIGPATGATATPVNGFFPTTLVGVQVTINGVNIPLLYVSANQINAVMPMELSIDAAAVVHVVNGTQVSADYPVWVVASTPLAFPPVVNQDGTINSQSNSAPGGSIVTFYATGWQSSVAPLADGQAANGAQDACFGNCHASVSTGVGPPPVNAPPISLAATVLYGGAAPGSVAGVTQFNVQIGTYAASGGLHPFTLTLTNPTVTQTIWIAP